MAKDRFPWPILGKRDDDPGIDIEPGETERMDFEFLVPRAAKVIRVYAYFRNDLKKGEGPEVGWSGSDLISLEREQKALP